MRSTVLICGPLCWYVANCADMWSTVLICAFFMCLFLLVGCITNNKINPNFIFLSLLFEKICIALSLTPYQFKTAFTYNFTVHSEGAYRPDIMQPVTRASMTELHQAPQTASHHKLRLQYKSINLLIIIKVCLKNKTQIGLESFEVVRFNSH